MSALMWQQEWTEPIAAPRPQLRLVGPDEAGRPAAGRRGWELTRRGQGILTVLWLGLLATAAATIVWGFLQVSNAPLA
jgi:hypothetical protein